MPQENDARVTGSGTSTVLAAARRPAYMNQPWTETAPRRTVLYTVLSVVFTIVFPPVAIGTGLVGLSHAKRRGGWDWYRGVLLAAVVYNSICLVDLGSYLEDVVYVLAGQPAGEWPLSRFADHLPLLWIYHQTGQPYQGTFVI
jgi:hypothetical protein